MAKFKVKDIQTIAEDAKNRMLNIEENTNAPKGTISTPAGEMAYIIDNTDRYYGINGFVTIDPEHYLIVDYPMDETDEPTDEKEVEYLTNFAQGLKSAQ